MKGRVEQGFLVASEKGAEGYRRGGEGYAHARTWQLVGAGQRSAQQDEAHAEGPHGVVDVPRLGRSPARMPQPSGLFWGSVTLDLPVLAGCCLLCVSQACAGLLCTVPPQEIGNNNRLNSAALHKESRGIYPMLRGSLSSGGHVACESAEAGEKDGIDDVITVWHDTDLLISWPICMLS